jgi:hypothetical protein
MRSAALQTVYRFKELAIDALYRRDSKQYIKQDYGDD